MKKLPLRLSVAVLSLFAAGTFYAQDYSALIKTHFQETKGNTFQKPGLLNLEVITNDTSASMNGTVVKFQQTFQGYPVYNGVGTALIKDGNIVYFNDNFEKQYANTPETAPGLQVKDAFAKAAQHVDINDSSNFQLLTFNQPDADQGNFAKNRLIYIKSGADLKLAYEFVFPHPGQNHYWNIYVDAQSGAILKKDDLNVSCTFHHDAYGREEFIGPHNHSSHDHQAQVSLAAAALAPDAATYNVFPFPIEAPTFGARSLVVNPYMVTSSPEGWHYDGSTRYTITRGNNVHAYEDAANNNTPGNSADGGATRVFDFPYDNLQSPSFDKNAAITNLFYTNNMVHDIFYKFGFTAPARNFQQTNFGLGGIGNDYVNAEAQDGGGNNNANFATPPDGSRPRMQMYLWSPTIRPYLFYNTPADAVPRRPVSGKALTFGPALDMVWGMGDVQLANVLDGCAPLTPNSLTGKIGLVERSANCAFSVRVKNVQDAGGVGAIVYNGPAYPGVVNMGGTDPTIGIPSVLVDNAEGEFIKAKLAAGITVNVTLKDDPSQYGRLDGSFDNGVIIHEYGHGISNRNTGNGYSCLSSSNSKEQMGEGWSDFFAMMLTNQPNDNAAVPRGMATYVAGQAPTAVGIRPARYSPNPAFNDYTYGDTNGMQYLSNGVYVPHVHSIGFVFGSILWDLHWKYVEKYGYSSDVTANATNGSSRVLQLVMDGLKLQECSPTFINGRDAILAAEMATTNGADRCMIWKTFADRGVGVNASAGSKTNINDQVEDFTVPADCLQATKENGDLKAISIYPNPAQNEFFINFPTNQLGKAKVEVYDASGRLVMSEDRIDPSQRKAFSTSKLTNGVYIVKVKGLGLETSSKLMVKK